MFMRRPLMALIWALIAAGGLAACGAAPQAPGSQAEATAATLAEGAATAAPAALATGEAAASAVVDSTVVAVAATSVAEAAATATALAPTAAAVAPTVAAAPTSLGGTNLAVPAETIAAMVADLAAQQSLAPDTISVVSAEAVSWPDGALGCPQPGMMYPQVITEGFRVILAAGGAEYAYHGDDRGQFFYCANPAR